MTRRSVVPVRASGIQRRSWRWFANPILGLLLTIGAPLVTTPLLAQAAGRAGARLSTSDIAKQASPSVVTITTSTGQGSGVIADATGVIVTNLHVIRGDTQVSVKLANGDIYDDLIIVEVDERKDLLLFRIKAVDLPAASMGNSDQVRVGDKVVLIGSPKGLDLTVSDGVISAVRDSGEGYRLLQTSAAASPGSSGGGMFNETGQLVGILSAKLTAGENLNFGIPVNYVRGLLSAPSRAMTLADFVAAYPTLARAGTGQRSGASTPSKTEAANIEALIQLLDASGLTYEKRSDTSWVVSYKGENLQQVDVYISLYGKLVVANSPIAKAPALTADHLLRLLQKSFELDLAKVALDKDKDLAALTEVELRLLDGSGLELIVTSVASAADDVAGILNGTSVETAAALSAPSNRAVLRPLSLLQGHAEVRYDSSEWKAQTVDEPGVFQFQHAVGDLYMKVITERIDIPLENLSDMIFGNAQKLDTRARVTRRGWREVNGTRMLLLEIDATASGIPVTYYYHCFSDSAGTIQLVGFTGRSLLNRPAIERFVAGFEVLRR